MKRRVGVGDEIGPTPGPRVEHCFEPALGRVGGTAGVEHVEHWARRCADERRCLPLPLPVLNLLTHLARTAMRGDVPRTLCCIAWCARTGLRSSSARRRRAGCRGSWCARSRRISSAGCSRMGSCTCGAATAAKSWSSRSRASGVAFVRRASRAECQTRPRTSSTTRSRGADATVGVLAAVAPAHLAWLRQEALRRGDVGVHGRGLALSCEKCGGRLRIVEIAKKPDDVTRVLNERGYARAPPRAPPDAESRASAHGQLQLVFR